MSTSHEIETGCGFYEEETDSVALDRDLFVGRKLPREQGPKNARESEFDNRNLAPKNGVTSGYSGSLACGINVHVVLVPLQIAAC